MCKKSVNADNIYCCDANEVSPECGSEQLGICSTDIKRMAGENGKYIMCPNAAGCGPDYKQVVSGVRTNIQIGSIPKDQACVIRSFNQANDDEFYYKLVESEFENAEVEMFYGASLKYSSAGKVKTIKSEENNLPGQWVKVPHFDFLTFVAIPKDRASEGSFNVGIFANTEEQAGGKISSKPIYFPFYFLNFRKRRPFIFLFQK